MATSRCPQPTSSSGAVPHPPAMIAIEQPPRSRRGRVDRLHLRIITFTLIVAAAGAAGFLAASTCAQPSPSSSQPPSPTTTPPSTSLSPPSPFVFGAWLNMGEFPKDVDSPKQWNQRLGFDAAAFEMRMSIPPWTDEPIVLQPDRWDDRTDAAVFMTVYADAPNNPVWPTEDDVTQMAGKLQSIVDSTGRKVLLRYMPEMDGEWMRYGAKPDQFIAHWKTMGAIVRRVAPSVEIVWSPNFDFNVRGGNAFWPGPEFVDWVGTSQYWKSSWMGLAGNAPVTGGYISSKIEFIYQNYAVVYNKSFVLSEASYGWEEPLEGRPSFANNVTQEEAQRAYWAQVFDPVFLDAHPLFKMAFVFEYKKVEDNMYRDFRVSWDPSVLAGIKVALQPLMAAGRLATAGGNVSATVTPTTPRTRASGSGSTSAQVAPPSKNMADRRCRAGQGDSLATWAALSAFLITFML